MDQLILLILVINGENIWNMGATSKEEIAFKAFNIPKRRQLLNLMRETSTRFNFPLLFLTPVHGLIEANKIIRRFVIKEKSNIVTFNTLAKYTLSLPRMIRKFKTTNIFIVLDGLKLTAHNDIHQWMNKLEAKEFFEVLRNKTDEEAKKLIITVSSKYN